MSLIPFILDLADELHEFSRCLANGIDINDFGFGLYTGADPQQPTHNQQQHNQNSQQPQQQPQTSPRRNRTSSFSSFWLPSKRHHPYNRIKTACCAKSGEDVAVSTPEKSDAATSSIGGTPGKSASYSVVNKNGFQVSMNVKQFAPNELSVKTIDNCIVVEGRHDDKEDGHGVISRHFVRKYMLPKGYDPNDVLSTLSSDGILTVKAPPPPPPAAAKNDESNERIIEIQPTPGPTPVLVVSAKDTAAKETTKKLANTNTTSTTTSSSSSSRLECQLPEKRQKLDLPSESEESFNTPASNNECGATAPAAQAANVELSVVESNDVEMEKPHEQVEEKIVKPTDITDSEEIELEKKVEIIEQAEKQKDKEQEKELNKEETEKLACSNGDDKNAEEKMPESIEIAEKIVENNEKTPAETIKKEENKENSSVTKMDVDDEDEGHKTENLVVVAEGNNKKTDNTDNVGANNKTADVETEKTAVKAAADDKDSAKSVTDSEKANNTDTSNKNSSSSNSTNTTITNNSSSTISTTNNSASNENNTENSNEKDVKLDDNGIETAEKTDVNTSIKEKETVAPATAAKEDSKTDTKAEEKVENETAELSTDKTTTTTTNTNTNSKTKDIIDDVALLKAATADPANITDTAEENVILSEPMDGITETDDSSNTNTTTNTTTTAVENVECSLFAAKKSHLGNGNNTTTATPVVGTEEMAN